MEVPPGFLELLANTLTAEPNLRLKAEEQLQFLEKTELQYPLVLIAIASDEHRDRVLRQLSLTLLKQYVLHSWSLSSERYTKNPQLEFLPQEQKTHIRQAMLHLLISPDHILRDLAANIVPKIAQADWPNDWPGFLEELSHVIEHSNNVTEVISVLKVLREFISETLTDESYFTIVPPINERLLSMQYNPSLLIRAKAQSVFRSCMEQMEMYKDTTAYQATVRSYIETAMGPWVTALNQNLAVDITTLSGDDYDAAVKLTHATFKTIVLLDRAFSSVLKRHLNAVLETVFSSLETIYPYYQQALSSPSVSPQLNRYVISLFGILQVILRGPSFDPDSSERQVELANGAIIDQIFFTETVRFTQIPDELCAQWLEEPQTIMDDTGNGLAVRTAVLSCAAEHFQPSFAKIWPNCFHSISGDWRMEEALFSLVSPILISPPSDYVNDIATMSKFIEDGMRSQNPIVSAAAISAAFVISNYLQRKEDYTEIIQIVIANPHPLVKIQGIAAINRTIGIQFSSPGSDHEEDTFENHEEFQKYTIQLIQSMASAEASDLSGLLVRCLSCILSLDPMIVYSTPTMDLAIHYFTILPEHPETRHTLSDTISSILPKLCSEGHPDAPSSIREKNFHWLQAVLNMVKTASQRPKGDPLISVSTAVLHPFLTWWVGPLPPGTVGQVFPALAGILLQEDDSTVLVMGQKVLSILIVKGYQEISQWKSSDGKTGLEVLMMVIEQGLNPSLDESLRVFSGPLISDLLQKAAGELQPILPMLLKIMITQLSTATRPEFIQSLIQVFATLLVIHPPDEILSFCSTFHESGQSGLEILLKTWTETFEVIQGYNQIRLSVVALSRVFEVGVDGIMVKGDEITEPNNSGRIVTRSLRKKVQWTSVPVKLKILKLLIRELANIAEGEEGNGSGGEEYRGGSVENGDGWESDDDDGNDWEDVTGEVGSETGEEDTGFDVSEDVLRGVNTKAFIIDFLRKIAASGERWELADSEVAILKVNHVI